MSLEIGLGRWSVELWELLKLLKFLDVEGCN